MFNELEQKKNKKRENINLLPVSNNLMGGDIIYSELDGWKPWRKIEKEFKRTANRIGKEINRVDDNLKKLNPFKQKPSEDQPVISNTGAANSILNPFSHQSQIEQIQERKGSLPKIYLLPMSQNDLGGDIIYSELNGNIFKKIGKEIKRVTKRVTKEIKRTPKNVKTIWKKNEKTLRHIGYAAGAVLLGPVVLPALAKVATSAIGMAGKLVVTDIATGGNAIKAYLASLAPSGGEQIIDSSGSMVPYGPSSGAYSAGGVLPMSESGTSSLSPISPFYEQDQAQTAAAIESEKRKKILIIGGITTAAIIALLLVKKR